MSKKVTSIDFVFENCEVRTLPINAIPSFYFYELIKNISHQWILKSEPVDEIETTISCRYAHFQIDYELAKKVKTNVMELFDDDVKENNFAKRLLRWNGITSINLHY